jgi:hypothetical protein
MHPEIMLLLAREHQAEVARSAAWASQVERVAAARPDGDPADDAAPVTDPLVPAGQLRPLLELDV